MIKKRGRGRPPLPEGQKLQKRWISISDREYDRWLRLANRECEGNFSEWVRQRVRQTF